MDRTVKKEIPGSNKPESIPNIEVNKKTSLYREVFI
jgi:hypothetical protein